MIDPFVILAAVLLLAVIALLRFVGCASLLGLDDVKYAGFHIDSIDPTEKTAGDAGFDLTVKGTGFKNESQVQWNGSPRNTTFDSGTKQLIAGIDRSDIAIDKAGTKPPVTVFNPKDVNDPNSQDATSNAVTFTVNNPKPQITGFEPQDATAGDPASPLTVKGLNFVDGLTVQLDNDSPFTPPPGSVTASAITFQMPAAKLANVGSVNVTVTNPAPGGGSASANFTIQELVKVTFPGPGPNDQPATGNSLNFDATVWSWETGNQDDSLPHIFSHQSGSFTFVNGAKLLKSMKVSANYIGGDVTVDNGTDPAQTVSISARTAGTPGTQKRLEELGSIKFTKKTTTVTVSFSLPDSLVIDTILYQGPR